MSLKITTLVENSPGENLALKHEHGLSFYIEKDGHKFLFDTGQTGALVPNARELRKDLAELEYVVISHGHYDHSGGLKALAEVARNFRLVVGRGFFKEKYGYKKGVYKFLGADFDEKYLERRRIPLEIMTGGHREIMPGVHVVTGFERIHEDETVNPRFKLLDNGGFVEDAFEDEVLVAIETPKGLAVLLGCSHPGVKNMLDTVLGLIDRPIYAVLGGTHLVEASEESLRKTVDYFRNSEIKALGVSHCTGKNATELLKVLGDRFFQNNTGGCLVV